MGKFLIIIIIIISTLSLQSDILSGCVSSDNNFLQSCLLSWSAQFGYIPEILPPKQPLNSTIQYHTLTAILA